MIRVAHQMRPLDGVAAVLGIAAVAVFAVWGLWLVAGLWLAAILVIGGGDAAMRPRVPAGAMVLMAALLVPLLVVLAWEGGLLLLPAACALTASHATATR